MRGYAAVLMKVAGNEVRRRLGRPFYPYKLEFFTTFSCQSRCRTCNIWSRYIEDPEKQKSELGPSEIARVVGSARRHVRWVALTGGEVTDREDFVDIVRGVVRAGDRLGLMNVTTNGLDPDKTARIFGEVARLTRGIPFHVNVSLEPNDAMYTAVRGIKGGYAQALESLAQLRQIAAREPHFGCGYLVTLSDLNSRVVNDLRYVGHERLGQMTLGIATNAQVLTRGKKDVNTDRSSPELAESLQRIWSQYRVRSFLDLPPKIFLGLSRRFLRTNRAPLPCEAGKNVLSIDPYGQVMQCFHIGKPLARLADHDFDLLRLCDSGDFQAALAPDCRDCWQACQAYPSMFHHPIRTAAEYGKSLLGRA
jgi:MoaA/NifB/PqqE/SkfB family radical SAM enzyme